MSDHEAGVKRRLIGAWALVAWEEAQGDGAHRYPFGPDAVGQLIYTGEDQVSVQLLRARRQRFAEDDWQIADAGEMQGAWASYFGYFGHFSINVERQIVVHHVVGSWFPNMVGTDQIRRYSFDKDLLVLHGDTMWGPARLVWRKLS